MNEMSTSKTPSQRQLRVGEEIRHALASVLARNELRDPAMHDVSLTVTEVRISPDLKNATAFVLPLGGGDDKEILKALKRAAPYLRGQIAREVHLRAVPRLSFQHDGSFDEASHIDEILKRPEVQQDLQHEEEEE